MKVLTSKSELLESTIKGVKRALNEVYEEGKTDKWNKREEDYIKANRKGNRDGEKEKFGPGFKQTSKVHKTQKNYNRKGRDKYSWRGELDENHKNLINIIEEIIEQELNNNNSMGFEDEWKTNKNTPIGQLASRLVSVTEDDLLSEPDDYGFKSNELEKVLAYNDYKVDVQLLKRIISYLYNHDIISINETNKQIDVNNSNNPEAAEILMQMQKLLGGY